MTFDEYYDTVCERLKVLGYEKTPDRDTVEEDFDNDLGIDDCVDNFEEEWGDPDDVDDSDD